MLNSGVVATSLYISPAWAATAAFSRPTAPLSNKWATEASRAPGPSCDALSKPQYRAFLPTMPSHHMGEGPRCTKRLPTVPAIYLGAGQTCREKLRHNPSSFQRFRSVTAVRHSHRAQTGISLCANFEFRTICFAARSPTSIKFINRKEYSYVHHTQ